MKDVSVTARRFVQAFALVFAVLVAAYLLRGQVLAQAARDAAAWSALAAALFAGRIYYNRRTQSACALCRDSAD